ncbi:hypothetical protein [Clostridium tyrobutyricum]|jgi:hypothetical protein|uniref:hypothetical protein n=1 Tax=Clostridium tyrobutyricum TaxID=1519 RepID=UPI001FA7D99C|nr:hypothetical protein [Clostridium tyrobutyricum]MCH4236934.1 hypothetical protein [Clostridium tyrobutyricum]MCI1992111.1 hypothetical protein [Clostridium tyrobutyricum]MCI2003754.1 hypothetical protein [Clostridium tyrobutyricum]MCI2009746.1 hypothetical protein [Clostridium tyrobutyricum]
MDLAGIWNVNSVYNVNNKKISTKLSFDIGEKFSAKVVKTEDGSGNILLKRSDGWQFPASVENSEKISENEMMKFEVSGFEDGKIKLKVVNEEIGNQNPSKDAIELFIKEKFMNLTEKDYGVIREMLIHNIPLTKDNISNIKTLLDFMNKIQSNPEEKSDFIEKYLASKNISLESSEGKFIIENLKIFFEQLSTLSDKDVLTFIENNIDLNSENIKSFNNIFKNDSSIYREIENLSQKLNMTVVENNMDLNSGGTNVINQIIGNTKDKQEIISILTNDPGQRKQLIEDYLSLKNIPEDSAKGKFITSNLSKLTDRELITFVKNNVGLNSRDTNVINQIISDTKDKQKVINILAKDPIQRENLIKEYLSVQNIPENSAKGQSIISNLSKLNDEELITFIKNNIDLNTKLGNTKDIEKIINELKNNPQERENFISKYLSDNDIALESDKGKLVVSSYRNLLNGIDGTVDENIEKLNIIKDILNNIELKNKSQTAIQGSINNTENIIKDQINSKTQEMINIIKNMISDGKLPIANKNSIINSVINDFKIFNTVSNSYYYMDVPLKIQNNDYNFKMMIRDERKKGKKIDTTNVKIATSISTENMGIVDAYLSVKNKNMNVNIESIGLWSKILAKGNKKIVESLSELGYNINVEFNEKKEDINISTCREFFQDSELGVINTRA